MKYLKILAILALSLGLSVTAQADTRRIYPNTSHTDQDGEGPLSSVTTSLVDLVRFLMDDCDGAAYDCVAGAATAGPGWTAIRAHSNAAYEDLPTPTDLDSLTTATAWEGSGTALAAGDWIVLESATSTGGGGASHFQLYIEYESTTKINFLMLPMEDWSTSSTSPPVWTAGNACGAGACKGVGAGANTLVTFTTTSTTTSMLAVADEDVLILLRDDGTNPDWFYVGGVDNNLSTSTPADDRPFVIMDNPTNVYFLSSDTIWNRLAPDDVSVLQAGYPAQLVSGGLYYDDAAGQYNGSFLLYSVPIMFHDTSHVHITGTLQYMRQGSDDLGTASRTINGAAWACRSSNATYATVCWSWDGVAYP